MHKIKQLIIIIFSYLFFYQISYATTSDLIFYSFIKNGTLTSLLQCVAQKNPPTTLICLNGTKDQQQFYPIDIIIYSQSEPIQYWRNPIPLSARDYQQFLSNFFQHPNNKIKKVLSIDYFNQCIGVINKKQALCGKKLATKNFTDLSKIIKNTFNIELPERKLKNVTSQVDEPILLKPKKEESQLIIYLIFMAIILFGIIIWRYQFTKKKLTKKSKPPPMPSNQIKRTTNEFILYCKLAQFHFEKSLTPLKSSNDFNQLNKILKIESILKALLELQNKVEDNTLSKQVLESYLSSLSDGWLLQLFRGQALIASYYPAVDHWWSLRYGFDLACQAIRDLFYQNDLQIDYIRLLAPMQTSEGIQITHDIHQLSKIYYIKLFFEQAPFHQAQFYPVIDISILGYQNLNTGISYPSELVVYNPAEWR